MMHRRKTRSCPAAEALFRLLFHVLLIWSVLRVIDLLPPRTNDLQPTFSNAAPTYYAPSATGEKRTEGPAKPEPLAVWGAHAAVLSRGMDLRGKEPRILIYHTHTTEAYTATESSPYVQTSAYRTADAGKSVLAVGEALAQRLRTQYGFAVIHDTTDHEPPRLKTAYERSERTMRDYLERYPSLILFIDVHRDAGSDASDYVLIDGRPAARLMCVVGRGTKYAEKPDFDRNYAMACALTAHLRRTDKGLARDVRVKTGRYNQHVGQLSLLIEVGHNANTLEQALNAVPPLAEGLALTLAEMEGERPAKEEPSAFCRLLVPAHAGIDKE